MRMPTALMIRLLVSLPNRKFPSRILNGLRVGNPQANFSRSPKPSQEIVFPYSNICFTQFIWVSPWASMVASSFNLAKGIALPMSAGTSPWAVRSGMLSLWRPIQPPLYICCRNHANRSIYAARQPAGEEEQRNRYQTYRVLAGIKNQFMDLVAGCYDILASLVRLWRALRSSIKQRLPRWI